MALIAYWKFDDDATDSSGSGFNLTASGTPTYTTGKKNNCIVLNGSSQYLSASGNTILDQTTGDFSIAGWIYRTSDTGGNEYILRKHSTAGYRVYIDTNDKLIVHVQDSASHEAGPVSTTSIAINTWYFFAGVFDRDGNATLYLYDATTLLNTINVAMSAVLTATSTGTLTVGRNPIASNLYFPGRIDELRFYDHALTSGEVTTIYNDPSGAALVKVVSEVMNPSEASNYTRLRIQHIAETENSAEAANEAEVLARTLSESIQLGEARNQIIGLIKNIAEEVREGEAQNAALGIIKNIDEAENLSDLVQSVIGLIKIVNESSEIAEALNYVMGVALVKNIDEGIAILESLEDVLGLVRIVDESVQITEFSNWLTTIIKIVDEASELSELFNELVEDPEMLDHINVQVTDRQTSSSDTYVDVPGAIIPGQFFVPGVKYLIMCSAVLDTTGGNSSLYVRALHSETAFDQSEYVQETSGGVENLGTGNLCTYFWWTVYEPTGEADFDPDDFEAEDFETVATASEAIKLQIKSQFNTHTVGIDQISMTAVRLTDQLDENIDYFYNEVTADTNLTNGDSSTNNAAITTAITGDWLVLTLSRYTPGNTTTEYGSRLVRSGEGSSVEPSFLQEGEDTTVPSIDRIVVTNMRVFSTGEVSNTFEEKSYHDGGVGNQGVRHHSQVFALNLNVLRSHEFTFTEAEFTPTDITDFVDQIQSLNLTLTQEADVLVLGSVAHDANIQNVTMKGRIQVDGVDLIDTMSIDAYPQMNSWDLDDELPVQYQGITDALTPGAHTVTFDASTSDLASRFEDRFLVAMSMKRLIPGAGLIRNVDETIQLVEDALRALGLIVLVNEEERILEPTGGFDEGFDPEGFDTGQGIIKVLGITRTISEVMNHSEALNYVRALSRVVNESENLSELANRVMALTRVANETVEISETVNRLALLIKVIQEIIELAENASQGNILQQLVRVVGTGGSYDDFSGALWSTTADGFITPNGRWSVDANTGTVRTFVDTDANTKLEIANTLTGTLNSAHALAIDRPFTFAHIKCNFRLDEQGTNDPATQPWYCPFPFLGWVDDTHMLFFVLKTNGWEICKYDGGTNPDHQRFIATGATPFATIGQTYEFEAWVTKDPASESLRVRVEIDGAPVADVLDTAPWMDATTIQGTGTSPFLLNSPDKYFMAYSEASRTTWDNIIIDPYDVVITESIIKVLGKVRIVNESQTVLEAQEALLGLVRTVIENQEVAEALDQVEGLVRSLNEAMQVLEPEADFDPGDFDPDDFNTTGAVIAVLGLARTVTELEQLLENHPIAMGFTKVVNESVELGEIVQKIQAIIKIVNETTEIGESIPRLIGLVRQIDERVDLPEAINRLGALARVVNEGEEISEAVNRLGALVIAVTESETIEEAANQVRGLVRLINEDSTITEAFDRLSGLIRHANEVESIGEELSRILGMAKTVNETESVEEIANKVMGLVRVVSELEDVSESLNAVKGIVKVILESETLAEALNKIMTTPAIVRILFGDRVRFSTLQGETIYFPNTSDVVKSTRTDDDVTMD